MDWDFTASDIISGKVHYSQEEFLSDLKNEIKHNFPDIEEVQVKRFSHLYYTVCYYTAIHKTVAELSKRIKIPENLLEQVQQAMDGNTKILEAIIMRKFLNNLEESGGILGDLQNLELVNAQLRNFHKKLHL